TPRETETGNTPIDAQLNSREQPQLAPAEDRATLSKRPERPTGALRTASRASLHTVAARLALAGAGTKAINPSPPLTSPDCTHNWHVQRQLYSEAAKNRANLALRLL